LRELIAEIIGVEVDDETTLDDDRLLAYELGLASIELVALLDGLQQRTGLRVEALLSGASNMGDALDRLSVRWIVDQVRSARAAAVA
jgi:acyl carrier protein